MATRLGAAPESGRPARPRPGPLATRLAVAAAALLVTLAALAGVGMRATYGAQVTADEPQYLLTTLSLLDDADLDIADERASEVWRDFHAADLPEQSLLRADGSRLSPHNPLLPALLAVPVAAGTTLGVPAWVAAKVGLALLAGVLAGVLTWTAVRRLDLSPAVAAAVVAVLGASPPLSVYATQLYPELPAALVVALAVAVLTVRRTTWPGAVGVALAVTALPWLAVKYVPVAAVLAGWLLWQVLRDGDRPAAARARATAGLAAALALAGAGYLAVHQLVYGGWTPYAAGDFFVDGELTALGPDPDYVGRTQRLVGLLVDRDFGLARWQPAWLLLAVAAGWLAGLARRGAAPGGAGWLVAVLAAGWATATWLAQTMHGWWWPGRQLVVVLPVAVLLLAAWVGRHRWRAATLVATGLTGVGAHALLVAGTAVADPVWHTLVVDFARTPNPLVEGLGVLLPDLRVPSALTPWSVAAWLAVLAALAGLGWRTSEATVRLGRHPRARRPSTTGRRPVPLPDRPLTGE